MGTALFRAKRPQDAPTPFPFSFTAFSHLPQLVTLSSRCRWQDGGVKPQRACWQKPACHRQHLNEGTGDDLSWTPRGSAIWLLSQGKALMTPRPPPRLHTYYLADLLSLVIPNLGRCAPGIPKLFPSGYCLLVMNPAFVGGSTKAMGEHC